MNSHPSLRLAIALSGGLTLVGGLAGCTASTAAAPASSAPATQSAAAASDPVSSSVAPTGSAPGSAFKSGSYSALGNYQSPGGPSKIGVTVTVADGRVSKVLVKPEATNATAQQYEAQFASGISAVAVGKPLKGLTVGAVSGSSLTGQGFNRALDLIRQQAS